MRNKLRKHWSITVDWLRFISSISSGVYREYFVIVFEYFKYSIAKSKIYTCTNFVTLLCVIEKLESDVSDITCNVILSASSSNLIGQVLRNLFDKYMEISRKNRKTISLPVEATFLVGVTVHPGISCFASRKYDRRFSRTIHFGYWGCHSGSARFIHCWRSRDWIPCYS